MSDPYERLEELGRGGMGIVYRARDPRLGRNVALKCFLSAWQADAETRARFAREARVLARLNHPNVVQIHDYEAEADPPYLVMDLLPGGSLSEVVREGPLPLAEALGLLEQIGAGLTAAHAAGILHRDLKPDNVLFADAGHAVVTDFGLARSVDAQSLTQTGELLGTPAYMPPEQATGERSALGPATDVYALGALTYTLLTGQAPFSGGGVVQVLNRVLSSPPPSPRALQPDLPPAVDEVVLRALAKTPEARYPTVIAYLEALRAASASPPPPSSARWALPVLIGLATLIGGAASLAGRSAPSRPTPASSAPVSPDAPLSSPAPTATVGYPPPLEAAIARAVEQLEFDPRFRAVAGSLDTIQGNYGAGGYMGTPLTALERELDAAIRELPPRSEEATRCRLAQVQVLHVLRAETFKESCDRLLAELDRAQAPGAESWPLTRYVRLLHLVRFNRSTQLYERLIRDLTRSEAPLDAPLAFAASQMAWRVSRRYVEQPPPNLTRATHYAHEAGRLAQLALDGGDADPLRRRQRAGAYLHLARAAEFDGRYRDARLAYDQAVACDSDWSDGWVERAGFLLSLGDREQALADIDELPPYKVDEWKRELEGGRFADATTTQARVGHYEAEGLRLQRAGAVDEALRAWARGLGLVPEQPRLHTLRFRLLHELGRHTEALAAFERIASPAAEDAARYQQALRALEADPSSR